MLWFFSFDLSIFFIRPYRCWHHWSELPFWPGHYAEHRTADEGGSGWSRFKTSSYGAASWLPHPGLWPCRFLTPSRVSIWYVPAATLTFRLGCFRHVIQRILRANFCLAISQFAAKNKKTKKQKNICDVITLGRGTEAASLAHFLGHLICRQRNHWKVYLRMP